MWSDGVESDRTSQAWVSDVNSKPEALLQVLRNPAYCFKRIGLEAGPLSQWLFGALAEADLPVICVQTRHMQTVPKAQINKTDRNHARGIAQMMRVGLYRPVHVKTLRSQKLCAKPRSRSLESLPSSCTECGSKAPNSNGPQRRPPISLHSRTTEFPPTSGKRTSLPGRWRW